MIPWAMGCQLVSVNVQAPLGMLLLVDIFRENGSSGYVLKPERLKEGGERVSTFQEHIEREATSLAGSSLLYKVYLEPLRRHETILILFDCAVQTSRDRKFWKVYLAGR